MELIAQGTSPWQIQDLDQYDSYYGEGDIYKLQMHFSTPIAAYWAGEIEKLLAQYNLAEPYTVTVEGSTLTLTTSKGPPFPFAIVGAAIAAFIAGFLLATFLGWALYRLAPDIFFGLGTGVLLVGIAGLFIAWIATRGKG